MSNSSIERFLKIFKNEIDEVVNYIFNSEREANGNGKLNGETKSYLKDKGFLIGENTKIYDSLKKIHKNQLSFEMLCENHKDLLKDMANFQLETIEKNKTKFFDNKFEVYFDEYLNPVLKEQVFSDVFSKVLAAKFLKFLYDNKNYCNDYTKIYMLSILIWFYENFEYFNDIYKTALVSEELSPYQELFLLWRCYRICVNTDAKGNEETKFLEKLLYKKAFNALKTQIGVNYIPIPAAERNKNVVVVFTNTMLGNIRFSPTKVALDKCYTLIKHLGKKVILINTGDTFKNGVIPFNNFAVPNRDEKIVDYTIMEYKGLEIPWYQSDCIMPDLGEIKTILTSISRLKPYLIISLGSFNVTADLCDMFSPVITIPLVFSRLPVTESRFHAVCHKVSENEVNMLNSLGFGKDNIIQSLFTFDFAPQQNTYTRAMFNLPEEKFLIVIIGARLDLEITQEFVAALLAAVDCGAFLVFAGKFEKFAEFSKKDEKFANNARYLGYQKDILAILELCDLYVNPKRDGGGSSSGEAMFKGLPVVSFPKGDVALTVGEDFWVSSYEEMTQKTIRYITDKAFYKEMSEKAIKRSELILDTAKELSNMIKTAESRSIF